jgi:hypothetical protein
VTSFLFRSIIALSLSATVSMAQASSPAQVANLNSSGETTRSQLTALRDTFVKQTAESGIPCAIQRPTIVVHDVPSYGSYDPDTNTLMSPAWEQMSTEEQSLFYKALPPGSKEADARAEFEVGVHHWVIVHELGHWWEACRALVDHGDHYGFEFEADRIAAAYWNEHDPSVIAHQRRIFEAIQKKWTNPVPPGQTANTYFNTNYEALGPTPEYIWFQAQMCLTAFAQKPVRRFSRALAQVPRS